MNGHFLTSRESTLQAQQEVSYMYLKKELKNFPKKIRGV